MTSTPVKVNRALSVPAVPFDLPLAANHRASVTIAPPSAHIGLAPVQMRLISYDLHDGQVLKLSFLSRCHGGTLLKLYAREVLLFCLPSTFLTVAPSSLPEFHVFTV